MCSTVSLLKDILLFFFQGEEDDDANDVSVNIDSGENYMEEFFSQVGFGKYPLGHTVNVFAVDVLLKFRANRIKN